MVSDYPSDAERLRAEIAAAAARLVAEEGSDYSSAKRKAAKQILGSAKAQGNYLPDNSQIEDEVRSYNELFLGNSQPARLLMLRKRALQLMADLAPFNPHLTGAVLNGTAGEHSDIHLQLFTESPKDVEIYLLNRNMSFDVSETPHFKNRKDAVETLSFMSRKVGVHLALYDRNDLRGAIKTTTAGRVERANLAAVRALIPESEVE